jgi:Flp pilus assembly protein TadG
MRDLILRPAIACLARRLTGLRDDGGRGAVGVLVAVLIGGGVLFGMGALVVDVGQIYQNRAELQSVADAAALAVAKSCAAGICAPSNATQYVTGNTSKLTGNKASVNLVCGTGGVGTSCPATSNVCPNNHPTANYVDVVTSTLMPSGSHLLPPVFAGTLAGTHTGSTVWACAQAQWGPPATSPNNTIGLTITGCHWSPAVLYAPPPATPPSQPIEINFHNKSGKEDPSTCTDGQTAPGNFGWTDDPHNNCKLLSSDFTSTGGIITYGINTGNSTPSDCVDILSSAQTSQKPVLIPVYSAYNGQGSKAGYTLQGFAAFEVTGYHFGNSYKVPDRITGKLCGGNGSSVTCVSGYFVREIDQTRGGFGNTDLGLDIIKLTG